MIRKYLLSLPVLAAGLVPVAHAQFAVYGNITGERLTGVKCTAAAPTDCPAGGTDQLLGAGGGIYYNFMTLGPARIGADIRADITKSNKSASTPQAGNNAVRADEALGGLRVTFHSPFKMMFPYAQASLGWNRVSSGECNARVTDYCNVYVTRNSFFVYRVYGGLEFEVTPIMDVRIPEFAVGQNIGTGGVNSNWMQSVSVGVVFHSPRPR